MKNSILLAIISMLIATQTAWAAQPKRHKEGVDESTKNESASNAAALPPQSDLSAEMFLEILIGELNNEAGSPGTGFSLILDAAAKSGNSQLYQRAVDIALQARSGNSALEAARAWKRAHPDSREANKYVLDIVLALNQVEESREPLRTELSLCPKAEQAAVISRIPQLYGQVKDKALASRIVETTLAPFKERTDTAAPSWVSIAKMRSLAGEQTKALEALAVALKRDPVSAQGALVAIELASARAPGAEDVVKSALQTQPNPGVHLQWVRALIEMDRLNEAGEELRRITKRFPKFPDGWLLLAGLELERNQLTQAQSSLTEFLSLAPPSPKGEQDQSLGQAYLMMSQIAQKQNDENQANAWLAKIEDPQLLMRAQLQRAGILAGNGKLSEAIALIDQLPGTQAQEQRSKVLAKTQIYRDSKDFNSAYTVLSEYSSANPKDLDASYELAMIAEKLKRYDEMERILRAVIASNPAYAQAYNALGFSLADRSLSLEQAKSLIVKALEITPEDPFITDSLGWVEYRLGNKVEALAILQRAYAGKSDPEIAAHLGELLWVLGKEEEARRIWREGVQLSPSDEVLQETITRLKVQL